MGPLADIRVVELAALGPAPFCAMMLSDMGADVLRIARKSETSKSETSLGFSPGSSDFMARGRRTLALDLKDAVDLEQLRQLLRSADVVMEGFRPGVMERLGIGPDVCLAENPRLIYARMTGWGQEGPMAHLPGHDINYLAMSGTLDMMGTPKEPVFPLNLLGDFGGGGMYLAFGIVCALHERMRSGRGQVVDAAIVDGVASLSTFIHGLEASGQWGAGRGGNLLDGGAPFYAIYRTSDDRHLAVGAIEPKFFANLIGKLSIIDIAPADQWKREQWPDMHRCFQKIFSTRSRDEWQAIFDGSEACVSPVLTLQEAQSDPHNRARQVFVATGGQLQAAPAPRFSRSQPEIAEASDETIEAAIKKWARSANVEGRGT
ncbi:MULTISPECIES: CaiB/BaiF CoA-transferase family protein [unclassified Beijerinckia]|uniref:CaiB/BaiF CoA transferase family protein n=1 Tax=unclassified Beijerinckia TaxID=2638183 RepID=UPI000894653E|nr:MULTISPECIES: CaiB/BaiF CoA-transferase family protein [unclassified Beijerinckia]MDH7793948.1 alpha-methylacyl-CoA racemase [Beijerinckia sp. GAS462]SEB50044.1 alpha-methylacyl-CoA racemase [Beijerinckia sp. 28-YEA-48]